MIQAEELLALAERLARERHAGQVDKSGKEYWHHPQRVSAGCATLQGRIVGWLHDLLEDTTTTPDELMGLGFPEIIVRAVELDTRCDGEPYMDYIRRILAACDSPDPATAAAGRIAREVKLSDLADNMNLDRLPSITDADLRRLEKYRKARRLLETSSTHCIRHIACHIGDATEQEPDDYADRILAIIRDADTWNRY